MSRRNQEQREIRHQKRWTRSEDLRLLRQAQAFPQNMHKCFMIVAEELGRTESGVAARWYTKVSKDPANVCFFTASPHHVARNRKNGMGVESNGNIWRRLMAIIRNIC